MKNLRPDLIITVIWAIGSMITLVLMGMEVIHNTKVVDRLLITIPAVSAMIIGYWFSKGKSNGESLK
jgi:uncharacterized protein (DUF983 family)